MRFTVNGIWKITGQPTTVSIEATDSEAAAENAVRRGLDVKSVEKSRSIGPQLGPSVEEMDYARYVVSSRTSMGKILFGLLMAGLGIGATWYGYNIAAGLGLYMNVGCVVLDCAAVTIGSNVLCGPYVQIYTAYHPLDPEVRRQGHELARPVAIGDDVWLGGGVIVCPGVSIGEGTTIAAGSVVTRDIPPRVLVAGNPCRVLRPIEAKG